MMDPDWIRGLIGGLMIGLAAAMFLLVNGRIMGASGLLGGLLDGSGRSNWFERGAFIAGLILAPGIVAYLSSPPAQTHLTGNLWIVVTAGLLVGIGTRIGSGCTSGHGVCGISRLSLRSIVATLGYLLAGAVTILVARHALGVI